MLPELEALVAAHPLQERLHAQRMLALYRSGRQADALAAYRAAREVLVEQIGVEPGPELRRLHEAMLEQDPKLDQPAVAPPRTVRRSRGPPRRVLAVVGALLVVCGLAVFAVTRLTESDGLARIDENAVGVIEPDSGRDHEADHRRPRPERDRRRRRLGWVANRLDGTVTRLDGERDPIIIPVGDRPTALAFAAGSLWVVDAEERECRASRPGDEPRRGHGSRPATRRAASPPGSERCGSPPRSTGRSRASTRGQRRGPRSISARTRRRWPPVRGAVWVTSEEGGVVFRIEPRLREVTDTIGVGNGPVAVAVGEGAVWVVNRQDANVYRIDPATNQVTDIVPVARDPSAIAIGAGGVWVTSGSEGAVTRIDPATRRRAETIKIQSRPSAIAVADGSVWTAAVAAPAGHRGGTLRVESPVRSIRARRSGRRPLPHARDHARL